MLASSGFRSSRRPGSVPHGFLFFHRGSTHEYSTSKARETVLQSFAAPASRRRFYSVPTKCNIACNDAGETLALQKLAFRNWLGEFRSTHPYHGEKLT